MRKEFMSLNVEDIVLNPHQPRKSFDEGKIEMLADSIREIGLNTPITVRYSEKDDRVVLIDGERRLRALKQAGISEIHYGEDYIFKEVDEDKAEFSGLIANCMREDLQPCDKARAFLKILERRGIKGKNQIDVAINVVNRAKDYVDNSFLSEPSARNFYVPKKTVKQVAKDMKMVGISGTNAVDLLKILRLPGSIQKKIVFAPPNSRIHKEKMKLSRHGKMVERKNDDGDFVPVSFARELARLDDTKLIHFLLGKSIEKNWTSKKLCLMVNDFLKSSITAEDYIRDYGKKINGAKIENQHELHGLMRSMDRFSSTLTSFRIINLVAMADKFKQKEFMISGRGLLDSTDKLKGALQETLLTVKELSKIKENEKKVLGEPLNVKLTVPPNQRDGFRFSIPAEVSRKLDAEPGDTLEIQVNAIIK